MRSVGLGAAFARINPWTCPRCTQRQLSSRRAANNFSTKSHRLRPKSRRGRIVLLTAGAGTIGAGGLVAVSDEVKHGYAATERTARVASTLFTCINE